MNNIKIKPIITEKSLSDAKLGLYTFQVPADMTKYQIKDALSKFFSVEVKNVRTMKYKAIEKRNIYRRKVSTSPYKKAIVRLAKDQKIDIFTDKQS